MERHASHRHAFLAFDALRGLAALAVVCLHAEWLVGWAAPRNGILAVDLFFVLSGFVIAYAYDDRFASGLRPSAFFKLRLIRLYPLYILGTMIGLIFAAMGLAATSFSWGPAVLAIGMIPLFSFQYGQPLYPYNDPAWSLFYELIANAVYALTWRLWTIPVLLMMIGVCAIGLIGFGLYRENTDFGWAALHLPMGLVRIFFGFPVGVLLYRLYVLKLLPTRAPFFLVMAATAFMLTIPVDKGVNTALYDLSAVLIAIPIIVAAAIAARPPRILEMSCALLGSASYAIYMLHRPLLEAARHIFPQNAPSPFAEPVTAILLCAFMMGLSLWVDKTFDIPIRRGLMGFGDNKRNSKARARSRQAAPPLSPGAAHSPPADRV